MTTITIEIGATDVSPNVKDCEITVRKLVTTFNIVLRNVGGLYNDLFHADDQVFIQVNAAQLLEGYVDLIKPSARATAVAKIEQTLTIFGRNYGQDLSNRFVTGHYPNQKADDRIDQLLADSGAEISFSSPGTAPEIAGSSYKDVFILDAINEILEAIDYDGYIDDEKVLHIFAVGSQNSEISLACVEDSLSNNILAMPYHDLEDAYDLANYIVVRGKLMEDAVTEGNATDWTGESNNVVSNSTTTVKVNACSIRCQKGSGSSIALYLTFPKYGRNYLDFSKLATAEMSFFFYLKADTGNNVACKIQLKDTENRTLVFTAPGMPKNAWSAIRITMPVGPGCTIGLAGADVDFHWNGDFAFNWLVKEIKIYPYPLYDITEIFVDGLNIPTSMFAVAEDPDSQVLYKVRKKTVDRNDVTSQRELQQIADSILAKSHDPVERLVLIAVGTAGISGASNKWIYGKYLNVNFPDEGIDSALYRIIQITHKISKDPVTSGWDFIAELALVPRYTLIEQKRWTYGEDPTVAILRIVHERLRYLEQMAQLPADSLPTLPKAAADVFGPLPYSDLNVNWARENLLLNEDFEIDANNDGTPDGFTFSQEAGFAVCSLIGAGNSLQGSKAARITVLSVSDPITSRGSLTSEYVKVETAKKYLWSFNFKAETAVGTIAIKALWYNYQLTLLSTDTLYSGAPTTSWQNKFGTLTIPANARFLKMYFSYERVFADPGGQEHAYFDVLKVRKQLEYSDLLAQIVGYDQSKDDFLIEWLMKRQTFHDAVFMGIDTSIWTKYASGTGGLPDNTESGGMPCAWLKVALGQGTSRLTSVNTYNPSVTKIRFACKLKTSWSTDDLAYWAEWGIARYDPAPHVEISFRKWWYDDVEKVLEAHYDDGSTEYNEEITGVNTTVAHDYRIDVYTDKIEFYIDGVLKATISQGVANVSYKTYLRIYNLDVDAILKEIYLWNVSLQPFA